ncbi:hypothetical protein BK131_05845 [Paenibacillus amylolyticus]|uniref:DUF952 domain-containing protein n=2 Tax=Paenibacillus amylolyticus TaxID=1451 RepID=A0A1R1C5U2_PAEAM|nr:hypothetical protein BK131_05845 [Paenibacillus amylolyticus]
MMMIVHVLLRKEWEDALIKGVYRATSLEKEGFIHCSPTDKIVAVANYNYHGAKGLVLLGLDASKIKSKVVWEDLYNEGREYPHIYGELNLDAVVHTYDFEPDEEGRFSLPADLEKMQ